MTMMTPVTEKFTPSQGEAIDLSHHLSTLSKERTVSPLKGLQRYIKPGQISLAGGWILFCSLQRNNF